MRVGTFKPYRGYTGSIELTNGRHHGKLENIKDLVTYQSNTLQLPDLEKEFHDAVDDYISVLKDIKK